jgi:phosphate transport system substrate-binding protein
MTHGICTNLPSACSNAASQTHLPYDGPGSRCPQCGSALLKSAEDLGGSGQGPKVGLIAVAAAVVIVLGGGAWWAFSGKSDTGSATSSVASKGNEATVLRLHGSSTLGSALAPAMIEAFLAKEGFTQIQTHSSKIVDEVTVTAKGPDGLVRIEVYGHGSGTGFTDLRDGKADIGMSSRPIKKGEIEFTKALGNLAADGAEYVVALDGIAAVVNGANPVKQLTVAQLRDIFTGKVTDWAQVGGKAGAIKVYARDEKSGTYDAFKDQVLAGGDVVKSAQRVEDSGGLSDMVARDPLAIGFAAMHDTHQAKVIAITDGTSPPMRPTKLTVGAEEYPLSRRLYMYVPPKTTNALAVRFAEYAVSPEGQKVAEKAGFISQSAEAVEFKAVSKNAEYMQLTDGAHRLSVNLRFNPGSLDLDVKGQRDLGRIAAMLEAKGNKKSEVMLLGFTDGSSGTPCANQKLSQDRANAAAAELATYGVKTRVVYGFGSTVPVASDETEAGRERNRRVEVWTTDRPVSTPVSACK